MNLLTEYLSKQLLRSIEQKNTADVKYYYEILREGKVIDNMKSDLVLLEHSYKKAKLFLVEHLDKFPSENENTLSVIERIAKDDISKNSQYSG